MERAKSCTGCREGNGFDVAFSMAFQPIVDVRDGTPYAYEALVRGPNGEGAATVLAQLNDSNRYAFDQACRVKAIETAMVAGLTDGDARLSINFLPNSVYSPVACIQTTLRTAAANAMPLDRLIFEFTEGEEILSPAHVESIIETYKRMGFAVGIDDFGAGHAGLDLFARFVPDLVKIDMELIRGIDRDARRRAIVRGIVQICADLDTLVIAEGIETEGEACTLRHLGVRYHQGYLYAQPAFERLPAIDYAPASIGAG